MRFHQELGRCGGSLRIWRQCKAQGLQHFRNVEQLGSQGAPFSINSMRKAIVTVLKEGHDQLAARSFPLNGLVLLPCEGLFSET